MKLCFKAVISSETKLIIYSKNAQIINHSDSRKDISFFINQPIAMQQKVPIFKQIGKRLQNCRINSTAYGAIQSRKMVFFYYRFHHQPITRNKRKSNANW
ncbi:hypothetical protein RDI58_020641 [Solanum bulbocastanum]|uniref:Uncharacterized protein n=1 Tax=Solanum bulbocastanum TaxID=147425 RepID=A0AAN8Y7V5_SOLBU